MSIASDLTAVATNLNSALDEINTKIEAKGGTASETVYGVAAAVENLPSGEETVSSSIKITGFGTRVIKLSNGCYALEDSGGVMPLNSDNPSDFVTMFSTIRNQWRIVTKFKFNGTQTQEAVLFRPIDSSYGYGLPCCCFTGLSNWCNYPKSNTSWGSPQINIYLSPLEMGEWYYIGVSWNNEDQLFCGFLYDENGNRLKVDFKEAAQVDYTNTKPMCFGGNKAGSKYILADIDFGETIIECDNQILWGKTNSKTQNMGIFDFTDFSEFTEVEYIGFTGTQELKTDFTLLETSKYEIDIDLADMCGTGISRHNLPKNSSSVLSTRTSGKIFIGSAAQVNNTGRGIFGQNYADGTATEYGIQYDDSTNQNKPNAYPYVVGYWYEGGTKYYPITANLYGLKIWDNNILVRDFVPCYHTETGIIGMFDTVNNKFYMNAGTGTFLKGADVNA